MTIIKIFGYLRELAGKSRIEINCECKLKELFKLIREKVNPEFIDAVFKDLENFDVNDNIIILVNGKGSLNPNLIVRNDDTVSIMPFLSGGLFN